MRKLASLLSIVVLMVVSMALSLSAQEASPPADPMQMPDSLEIAPGVVADNMVFTEGSEAPVAYRLTFEPGVVYDVFPGPNLELGYLESGTLVMTLDAPVTVKQANDAQGEGTMYTAGTEFTLQTGDFLVLQPGVGGQIRNDSDEPASLSVAGLTPGGTGSATPEASPAG